MSLVTTGSPANTYSKTLFGRAISWLGYRNSGISPISAVRRKCVIVRTHRVEKVHSLGNLQRGGEAAEFADRSHLDGWYTHHGEMYVGKLLEGRYRCLNTTGMGDATAVDDQRCRRSESEGVADIGQVSVRLNSRRTVDYDSRRTIQPMLRLQCVRDRRADSDHAIHLLDVLALVLGPGSDQAWCAWRIDRQTRDVLVGVVHDFDCASLQSRSPGRSDSDSEHMHVVGMQNVGAKLVQQSREGSFIVVGLRDDSPPVDRSNPLGEPTVPALPVRCRLSPFVASLQDPVRRCRKL